METLEKIVRVRLFSGDKKWMESLCEKRPQDFPNKSQVVRAALMIFRKHLERRRDY